MPAANWLERGFKSFYEKEEMKRKGEGEKKRKRENLPVALYFPQTHQRFFSFNLKFGVGETTAT